MDTDFISAGMREGKRKKTARQSSRECGANAMMRGREGEGGGEGGTLAPQLHHT